MFWLYTLLLHSENYKCDIGASVHVIVIGHLRRGLNKIFKGMIDHPSSLFNFLNIHVIPNTIRLEKHALTLPQKNYILLISQILLISFICKELKKID